MHFLDWEVPAFWGGKTRRWKCSTGSDPGQLGHVDRGLLGHLDPGDGSTGGVLREGALEGKGVGVGWVGLGHNNFWGQTRRFAVHGDSLGMGIRALKMHIPAVRGDNLIQINNYKQKGVPTKSQKGVKPLRL